MKKSIKDAWESYRNGNAYISDEDLKIMISSAESGLEYLEARGTSHYLATTETRVTLDRLKSFAEARKGKNS